MTSCPLKSILATVLILLALTGAQAFAQGAPTTSSLSGVVTDSSGAVVPGADVSVKNNATSGEFRAITDATGTFTIPALSPGAYTVTISLMGFKTVVMPDVQLIAAQPARVKAKMEVGQLQEMVTVVGATEIMQTESSSVATTLTTKQIATVPLPSRNTLDFVASLAGVIQTGIIRDSIVMGLARSATNITIDGINVQDNYLKSSDGFYARISPRMDAVEEVTVSTANPGAESSGQGAVQIRFVTRSGSNKLQGSGYWYARRPTWNTNYWFNIRDGLPKEQIKVDTYGIRVGGPVKKDRLFYFLNYEEFRLPGTTSRNRTVLTADASNGIYVCNTCVAGGVNLLALAAQKGQTSTVDPIIQKLLADVQGSLSQGTLQSTGNPYSNRFSFANPSEQTRRYPTIRFDYNLASRHRLGGSFYWQQNRAFPDVLNGYDQVYPGFGGDAGKNWDAWSWMGNWRWSVSSNKVNELRFGSTGGPVKFGDGINAGIYKSGKFADWNGFAFNTPIMTTPYVAVSYNFRNAPTWFAEDTFSWIKGKHSISIGGSVTQVGLDWPQYRVAPTVSFGVDSTDPAYTALFSAANFPGWSSMSSSDQSNARSLYALLTGRVTTIAGTAFLDGGSGKYVYNGEALENAYMREFGFYVQDAWRLRTDLTITGGLRYELQGPFTPQNAFYSRPLDYCNSFGVSGCNPNGTVNMNNPGSMPGQPTQFKVFGKGDTAYKRQWKDVAPSLGIAWRPTIEGGFLKALLGKDPVIRAGYSKAYTREGNAGLSNLYYYNPGGVAPATRSMSLGTLLNSTVPALPLLLRNGWNQLGPAPFPDSPTYPIAATLGTYVDEFYPNTKTPSAHSFNLSFQRQFGKNMAVDIRYVGTRSYGGWVIGGRNLSEYNTIENGFLTEFKLAQANLAANNYSSFAYMGPGTGTSPLPIMLAYLNGSTASGTAASYTGSAWTSSTLYGYLARQNPAPQSFASYLQTNQTAYATNAKNAGLPANFFLFNPAVSGGGVYITGRPEDSQNRLYDALQIEFRRRMSGGFLIQGSYQYVVRSRGTNLFTVRLPGEMADTSTPRHSLKANWVYELPFGKDRKWGAGASRLLDLLIGGWSVDGNLRLQSGNRLDFGNYRLIGMSDDDLQKVFKLRYATDSAGKTRVYMLPQDIIDNTILAFSTSATSATGYSAAGVPTGRYFAPASGPDCVNGYTGQCSGDKPLHHYVYGPKFFRTDVSLAKRVEITKRIYGDLRLDVLNLFNTINFFGVTGAGSTSTSGYEVTSAYKDSFETQDPGGRLLQLSLRISF
jgi:hypothetical protein